MPSRTAQPSMLQNSADSYAVRNLRQSGVWWSIDTLRTRLEREMQTSLEPAVSPARTREFSAVNNARSVLSSRRSAWTTSLPQALSNLQLHGAQAPYMQAFLGVPELRARANGAVFVINGRIVGAEVYRSAELFQKMWPHLLRAYATEAIAAEHDGYAQLPSVEAVQSFLSTAHEGDARDLTIRDHTFTRDGRNVLYSESRDPDGVIIASSYLPKTLPVRRLMTPDALSLICCSVGA